MANNGNAAQLAYDNLYRILIMATQATANPTQQNIDNIVNTVAGQTGPWVVQPRITGTTPEGKPTYDWTGYVQMIIGQLKTLKELIVIEQGYFEVRSVGY